MHFPDFCSPCERVRWSMTAIRLVRLLLVCACFYSSQTIRCTTFSGSGERLDFTTRKEWTRHPKENWKAPYPFSFHCYFTQSVNSLARMDIAKADEEIDFNFSRNHPLRSLKDCQVRVNSKISSSKLFKEIVDVYLCKHNIPYTHDSSGSQIAYRCPFDNACTFSIRAGVSRSHSTGKRGCGFAMC